MVWESGAILYYLVDKYDKEGKYFGKTAEERAEVMIWLTHQLSGLGPVQGNLNWGIHYFESAYGEAPQKAFFTRFEGETHRLYKLLDDRLAQQKFVGLPDRVTIADLAFVSWVNIYEFAKLDIKQPYPHVYKWLEQLRAEPQFKKASDKLPTK